MKLRAFLQKNLQHRTVWFQNDIFLIKIQADIIQG